MHLLLFMEREQLIEEVDTAVHNWREHAAAAAVTSQHVDAVESTLRTGDLLIG